MDIKFNINEAMRRKNADVVKRQGALLPTYFQMKNPHTIEDSIKEKLLTIGLNDLNASNLFRITWKNDPQNENGGFGCVNHIILPSEITGISSKIVVLIGKWFPTGTHKVGAAISCLIPELVTGNFDITKHKAVWPSTGNYCRGGVYDSHLLNMRSIAILPEGMSQERFDWLKKMNCKIIKTFGCESNVKEIFDKCKELKESDKDTFIFNQFEEFGNYIWHYDVTGAAIEEVFETIKKSYNKSKIRGFVSAIGSGGTIAAGDYLKQKYPLMKIVASEALQCPTLLNNGFGDHKIEGIGDKHVPWIYNVKNTDMVTAIDDEACMKIFRMFNEKIGQEFLLSRGVTEEFIEKLSLFGISSVANILSAIKFAKYYELNGDDVIFTLATDSAEMYNSRIYELESQSGKFSIIDANVIYEKYLAGIDISHTLELSYLERKRIHNLKYYTWVEQQGKSCSELNSQWYDCSYWENHQKMPEKLDVLITEFNDMVLERVST